MSTSVHIRSWSLAHSGVFYAAGWQLAAAFRLGQPKLGGGEGEGGRNRRSRSRPASQAPCLPKCPFRGSNRQQVGTQVAGSVVIGLCSRDIIILIAQLLHSKTHVQTVLFYKSLALDIPSYGAWVDLLSNMEHCSSSNMSGVFSPSQLLHYVLYSVLYYNKPSGTVKRLFLADSILCKYASRTNGCSPGISPP